MENKIIRSYGTAEYRSMEDGSESRKVAGCAVKFDSDSQDMGFIERILRGAITQDVIDNSDIYARIDHREDVVLARSNHGKGSLKLELREDGLYYEFDAPHTAHGDELLEHLKRGEIATSSFAFSLPMDDTACERWYKDGELLRRDISKIDRIYDVSPVYNPAYLETSAERRKLDALNALPSYDSLLQELGQFVV